MSNPQAQPPHMDAGKAKFEAEKQRQLTALQNKIDALEQQIAGQLPHAGQVALRLHQAGHSLPPELQSLCAQMVRGQQQKAAIQQEMAQVRQRQYQPPPPPPPPPMGNLVCPHGHGPLAAGNHFCITCGSRGVAAPAGARCRRCGTPLESGVRFCTECGLPVSAPQPTPPSRCFKCGEVLLQPDQKFCVNCGQLLTERPPAGALPSTDPTIIEPSNPPHTLIEPNPSVKTLLIRPTDEDSWATTIPTPPSDPISADEGTSPPPAAPQTIADYLTNDTIPIDDLTISDPPPATKPSGSDANSITSPALTDDPPVAANPTGANHLPQSCPSCGAALMAGATACTICGFRPPPATDSTPTSISAPTTTTSPPTHCPRCQEPLMAGAAFCIICGYKTT